MNKNVVTIECSLCGLFFVHKSILSRVLVLQFAQFFFRFTALYFFYSFPSCANWKTIAIQRGAKTELRVRGIHCTSISRNKVGTLSKKVTPKSLRVREKVVRKKNPDSQVVCYRSILLKIPHVNRNLLKLTLNVPQKKKYPRGFSTIHLHTTD